MELVTLNSQMTEAKLIENYDSLLWTERFGPAGSFQLVSGNVNRFLNLLPEGSLVTLRDSDVPMIVETPLIERKKNVPEKVTITGRSFESIVDRRVGIAPPVAGEFPRDWKVSTKTPSDLAYRILVDICVDALVNVNDRFPADKVQFIPPSDYLASTGPVKEFDVPRGNLLSTVLDLLQTEYGEDTTTIPVTPAQVPHALRAVRPGDAGGPIQIQIYKGVDRRAKIYFDATRDLLDDGTYLFSKVGSANMAYGVGDNLVAFLHKGVSEPSGFDRRVILVDASSTTISETESLRALMSVSLSEAHETAMFDGSINTDLSPYRYGVDYRLGDIVRLVGDYGLQENARVTEYIRSEDATGEKAYPTLTTINI